ncbi:AraC family transcriptional regulator [Actinomycetospora sp. OC33-EN08]|uniref:AraC family transcriptional regulator n=1 Tax=Actinomycetospora aurantiaca TaxID=3129233 RepID=A0ABU8MGQ4_9PSEU
MDAVGTLLGTVHVDDPVLRVERLAPGRASIPTGHRWALVTLAAGELALPDAVLGPGDALLTRGRGPMPGKVGDAGTTVLVADFALQGEVGLARLPEAVVCPADSEMCRLLIERLAEQLDAAPSQDVVSARLLDWIVTETVRDALVAAPTASVSDPVVAAALAAVHADPAGGWTVEELARRAGVSRAGFAQRFRDAVGVAPLAYVRALRFDLAERALLTEPDVTVAAVARRVGYANPFSFSTAFRRDRGVAPSEVRARA